MTSTSRFADATSTLQVGHACGQPYDPKWGDEPTALTLQVEHAWGKPNIRNICNPDWGDEPTSSTLLAGHAWGQPNIRNPDWGNELTASILLAGHAWGQPNIEKVESGNEPTSFPPEPTKPNFKDTGKKHPMDVSACTPKISDITDNPDTKVLDRNGIPYHRRLDEEPKVKTGGMYKFWLKLKEERDTPTHETLLREFINSPHWSAPTGIDPIAPPASKPPPKPRKPKVEDTGVGGKKHPIDLSGTDESDVPLKRQHVANPMTYDRNWGDEPTALTLQVEHACGKPNLRNVGKKHVYIVKNYTPDQKGEDIRHGDVVRPSNHRWCIQGDDEVRKWSLKSTARCPTYGTCQSCYMCGPVGKRCIDCYDQEDPNPSGFVIMMDGKKILDSITIATILGQGQEIAKADRILNLHAIKMESLNSVRIHCAVEHVYKYYPERTTKEKLRRDTTLKLYNLVN